MQKLVGIQHALTILLSLIRLKVMAVRFDIEEAEWPPLAQGPRTGFADLVAHINFGGKRRQVALRAVPLPRNRVLLYGRDLEHEPTGSWVVCSGFDQHPSPDWPHMDAECPLSYRLQNALKSFERGEVGRLFRRDTGSCAEVAFWRTDGRGCWRGFGLLANEDSAEFEVSLATPLLQMNWQQAHQAFAHGMADPSSNAAFALRWADLSRQEQLDFALRFKRGNKAQFERVLRAACLCDHNVMRRGGRWRWNIGFNACAPCSSFYFFAQGRSTAGEFVHVSPFLSRWFETAWNYFHPFNDEALLQKHSCIDSRYSSKVSELWIEPPTAHERVEAALFLREWLGDHVPREQHAALCLEPMT